MLMMVLQLLICIPGYVYVNVSNANLYVQLLPNILLSTAFDELLHPPMHIIKVFLSYCTQ